MINLNPNKCLKCSKSLTGRADKKFCDSFCRNSFNNSIKSQEEVFIKNVNAIIRKNRRILKTLSPEGKAIVRKEIAIQLGFDFNQFSSFYSSKLGVYYLCYDYGYRALLDNGKEKLQIIHKQDYMESFNPWKYIK